MKSFEQQIDGRALRSESHEPAAWRNWAKRLIKWVADLKIGFIPD